MKAGRNKAKKRISIFILIILIIIAAAAGIFIANIHGAGEPLDADSEEIITVEIPDGAGTGNIGEILEENGLIKSSFQFKLKSKIEGYDGQYKKGTYELSPSMSMEEMMVKIITGKQNVLRLTIPEGFTLEQTAERVAEAGTCTAEEFLNETQNGTFDFEYDKYMATGSQRYEGFLYPDTYEIYVNESAHSIIQRMLTRFEEIYSEEAEGSDMTSKYDMFDLITAASIIEREVKLDEERPLVASVIYNRLDKGMKLQMCSTVQYALGTPKARLLYSDLEIDSPYNTYKRDGLPAGPISSPGQASINAALHPADTDYLYFVLTSEGSGKHNFAATGDDFSSYKDEYLSSLTD
jgi:UPF0755 protein